MNPAKITATVAQYESIEIMPRPIVQGRAHHTESSAIASIGTAIFLALAVSLCLAALLGREV